MDSRYLYEALLQYGVISDGTYRATENYGCFLSKEFKKQVDNALKKCKVKVKATIWGSLKHAVCAEITFKGR